MKPYPFLTLNHFTVPKTFVAERGKKTHDYQASFFKTAKLQHPVLARFPEAARDHLTAFLFRARSPHCPAVLRPPLRLRGPRG